MPEPAKIIYWLTSGEVACTVLPSVLYHTAVRSVRQHGTQYGAGGGGSLSYSRTVRLELPDILNNSRRIREDVPYQNTNHTLPYRRTVDTATVLCRTVVLSEQQYGTWRSVWYDCGTARAQYGTAVRGESALRIFTENHGTSWKTKQPAYDRNHEEITN